MRSQIKLGKVFGIQIGLHYSWLIIALLIVFSLMAQFHATNHAWSQELVVAMAVVTAILFFVSLLLHELAHSLVASTHGLPVREITLFALGGVSQIEKNPTSAKLEFWMAFVGPLTSAVIGAVCVECARMFGAGGATPWIVMLLWLGYINLSLAVFNLIPGYPLDGGRVLRAIFWWKTGSAERSTRLAAVAGQVVALAFIAVGIFQFFRGAGIGGLWIAFIGWFLLQAARESYAQVGLQHSLDGIRVADVMSHHCPEVEGDMSVQRFVDDQLLRTAERCFIVMEEGRATGLITLNEVGNLDRGAWPLTPVHQIMRPLNQLRSATPEEPVASALTIMANDRLSQLPVVSDHHLEGVLSREDLLRFLQVRADLHKHAA